MVNGVRRRLAGNRRETVNKEIEKLNASVDRLSLGRVVPLRVKLALRTHERSFRKGALIVQMYGFMVGVWWLIPLVLVLDDKPDSMRNVAGLLLHAATETMTHSANSADLVSGLLRVVVAGILTSVYYAIVSVGPTVLGFRVAMGFSGFRVPGRNIVLMYRRSTLVYCCSDALVACAEAFGKSGEKRVELLQKLAGELRYVRSYLRIVHRFAKGFSRRRRRKRVRLHALKVEAVMIKAEESTEEMTDCELRELGEMLLAIAEKCANGQYGNMLEGDKIANVVVPDREPIRVAAAVLLAAIMSVASVYLLHLLGLSGSEPVVIPACLILATTVIYGRKALEKIDSVRRITGQ
jgi:hypothetical protein